MSHELRARVATIFEADLRESRISRIVKIFLICLILFNVLAIVMESVSAFQQRYHQQLRSFEVLSVMIFTVEYLLRLWSCPDIKDKAYGDGLKGRIRYALTPMALIDLIAILPFYLSIFFALDLRFLRVIRLLRIFKLSRYSSAMNIFANVYREQASSFIAAFFLMLILMVLAASGIYLIEHDIQPEAFGSIPAAMWWAMATLTTVGYGDVTPITPWGKFFGGCITVIGTGMVALPAGILASGFAGEMRRRRMEYEAQVAAAFQDGSIDDEEQATLNKMRQELGVNDEDAELIYQAAKQQLTKRLSHCPHCDKPLFSRRKDDHNHTK